MRVSKSRFFGAAMRNASAITGLGDIPALFAIIDRALAREACHADSHAPKSRTRDEVRTGLVKMKHEPSSRRDEVRATHSRNELEN